VTESLRFYDTVAGLLRSGSSGSVMASTLLVRTLRLGVSLGLMGFERCKVGRSSGIRQWIAWANMPPERTPTRQDTTSALAGLTRYALLQGVSTARRHAGCAPDDIVAL